MFHSNSQPNKSCTTLYSGPEDSKRALQSRRTRNMATSKTHLFIPVPSKVLGDKWGGDSIEYQMNFAFIGIYKSTTQEYIILH
jgi:hypothetical protein